METFTRRVYLSGAMRGHPEENKPLFDKYAEHLRSLGNDVFVPHAIDDNKNVSPNELFHLDCSKICIWADEVAVIPGWEDSLGVKAEIALANAIGLKVTYLG